MENTIFTANSVSLKDGYFEGIDRQTLVGWIYSQSEENILVLPYINKEIVTPLKTTYKKNSGEDEKVFFEIDVNVKVGDRIELINGKTGQPLAGGVRRVIDTKRLPRIGIVAPVKQEAKYLVEWIAYHRVMGVDEFLLGDNGGTDGTTELLQRLKDANIIDVLDWREAVHFQLAFYADAVPKMKGRVDLCAIHDIDEFLRPMNGRSNIKTALAEIFHSPKVSAAALNYAIYGSSGLESYDDRLVIERFKRRAQDDFSMHQFMKSVIRPERFNGMPNAHECFVSEDEYVNDIGDMRTRMNITWNSLRVDHYVIKSREEFREKALRGRVFGVVPYRPRDDAFFAMRDQNQVEDPPSESTIIRVRTEMNQIMAEIGG